MALKRLIPIAAPLCVAVVVVLLECDSRFQPRSSAIISSVFLAPFGIAPLFFVSAITLSIVANNSFVRIGFET